MCEREKVLLQTGLRVLITVKHQTLISGIKTLYESSCSKLQRRKNIQKKPAGVHYFDLKASFSLNCGATGEKYSLDVNSEESKCKCGSVMLID